jgi:mono/diheme cytochrome c family protein
MKKLLVAGAMLLGTVLLLALGGAAYVQLALPSVGPAPDLVIEPTEARVERGRYLANHVMLCMDCHARRDWSRFSGPPLAGTEGAGGERFGHEEGFPGVFYSRNITPGGVADWTDGELFRLITTGVKRDGSPIFPVMPYLNYGRMEEEDIKAVIAYIRTLEPRQGSYPESAPDFPFNFILRTMPAKAVHDLRQDPVSEVAMGEYLVNAAACGECHTKFEGGKFTGRPLAGGRSFEMPDGSVLTTPNLTFHETGLKGWTREMFIARFKTQLNHGPEGRPLNPGEMQTVMPWIMYAGMEESDLGAMYAYLSRLHPVNNPVVTFKAAN